MPYLLSDNDTAIIMLNHDFITPRIRICIKGLGNEVYIKNMTFSHSENWRRTS